MRALATCVLVGVWGVSLPAQADERWLVTAGGAVTRAVSTPQADAFGMGASGSGGFYRSLLPWMQLGTRFTASVIGASGQAPAGNGNLAAPETGGLYTLTLATRFRPFADPEIAARATGLWIEGGGGVARTGALWRPALEAGIGYGFSIGPVVLSPTVRFQQLIEGSNSLAPQDGRFASAGIELTFNDGSEIAPPPIEVYIETTPLDADHDGLADVQDKCPYQPEDKDGFRDGDGCPEHDVDGDMIADADDDCPDEPETRNGVNDYDGCPDSGKLEVVKGLIVVDDKVFFGFDSYRISTSGLAKLRELAESAQGNGRWIGLTIEGHADTRGTRRYNQTLSERRAEAVKAALKAYGLDLPIAAIGFGETRPLVKGARGKAHKKNRRVEIRVEEQYEQVTTQARQLPMSLLEGDDE